ncbi:gamma-type small acid-soluble spore protein [Paenibacillus sp. BSR1-1]|uniref:gamma-type small acid-soluble spore protein n=1 Tax=Paenibacillus sp. BSR1-1 TaxID=3020845 RepID=UPI0025AF9DDC|nr:gamma-type small acid-soluble spore protein [Paenibacillus sp. BSR1-1]MDN3017689.1 gamma-type small acid-soluble spore protein [Paenibacillus sp. BSR1-1]
MANFNQQPNKTSAGTNIQEVRQQNANSQAGAGAAGAAGQFGTEFASETNAAEVRAQNQQSQARKGQGNAGQFGQS